MKVRPFSKYTLPIFLLALLLITFVAYSALQTTLVIPSSGNVLAEQNFNRRIYFEEGFEDEPLRTFGWGFSYPPLEPPINWGADISDENGAYAEIINNPAQAYEGDKMLYTYAARATTSSITTYAYIYVRLLDVDDAFYVGWYQQFENLPTSGKEFFIFTMASGVGGGALYSAQTMDVKITSEEVSINHLYGSVSSNSASYSFENNRWYFFEAYYKCDASNGEYRLWIDGNEVLSVTGQNTVPTNGLTARPAGFEIGLLSRNQDADYGSWLDNIVCANYKVPNRSYLFRTSFEESTEIGFTLGGSYGGNVELSTANVRNGYSSARAYGFKTWRWEASTSVSVLNGAGGNVTVGTAAPNQIGTMHFPYDYFMEDASSSTGYSWYQTYPRGRIILEQQTIPVQRDLYMRVWVYFDRLDGYVQLLRIMGFIPEAEGHGSYIARTTLSSSYVTLQLGQNKHNGDRTMGDWKAYDSNRNVVTDITDYSIQFELNRWYCIEQRFVKSNPGEYNGGGQIWVDGQLVINRMDLDTSEAPDPTNPITGLVLTNNELDFYIDDWVVDTKYIGP